MRPGIRRSRHTTSPARIGATETIRRPMPWLFIIDEKSQIQALDCTQPVLPMKNGRAVPR